MARLGILGGMGPMATIDLYRKIVEETGGASDQDNLPVVIWSDPTIPDRSTAILDPSQPSPLDGMLRGVAALERAGVAAIAIACNTAHHFLPGLVAQSAVPILHIADAVVVALAARGVASGTPIAVLATRGTLASGFYRKALDAAGYRVVEPEAGIQQHVSHAIGRTKAGRLGEGRASLALALEALRAGGVTHALLACTELPLLVDEDRPDIIDANRCLARACVEAMRADAAPARLVA